jgi:hypothetical protein
MGSFLGTVDVKVIDFHLFVSFFFLFTLFLFVVVIDCSYEDRFASGFNITGKKDMLIRISLFGSQSYNRNFVLK